jgi:phosphoglucomutase
MENNTLRLAKKVIKTTPYNDQNPGTSGLRKKSYSFSTEKLCRKFCAINF